MYMWETHSYCDMYIQLTYSFRTDVLCWQTCQAGGMTVCGNTVSTLTVALQHVSAATGASLH